MFFWKISLLRFYTVHLSSKILEINVPNNLANTVEKMNGNHPRKPIEIIIFDLETIKCGEVRT